MGDVRTKTATAAATNAMNLFRIAGPLEKPPEGGNEILREKPPETAAYPLIAGVVQLAKTGPKSGILGGAPDRDD